MKSQIPKLSWALGKLLYECSLNPFFIGSNLSCLYTFVFKGSSCLMSEMVILKAFVLSKSLHHLKDCQ